MLSILKVKKKPVSPHITGISVGNLDPGGNTITYVLVKHDEFAIYEIDTPDINNRVKTLIDGHTDESEQKIQDKFNSVKQKYIQAIGLLSNTSNMEMLKRRIAHTLSSCLSGDIDGNEEFSQLINTLQEEHEKLVVNRILYVGPVFLAAVISLYLVLKNLDPSAFEGSKISPEYYLFFVFLSILSGASISILINATKLNFEAYLAKKYYFLLGMERLFLAVFTGCMALVCMKTGLLLPEFTRDSDWGTLLGLGVAGFSESFVPSFLTKAQNNN